MLWSRRPFHVRTTKDLVHCDVEEINHRGVFFLDVVEGRARWPQGLLANSAGVNYVDSSFHIVIPWSSLIAGRATFVTEEGYLGFNMVSAQPGIGYIVHRARATVRDEVEGCPFRFHGAQSVLETSLRAEASAVAHFLEQYHHWYLDVVGPQLAGDVSAVPSGIEVVDEKDAAVIIKKGALLRFPAFCPISGQDCDQLFPLKSKDHVSTLRWFLSSRGIAMLKYRSLQRMSTVVLSVLLYWLYGGYLLLGGDVIEFFPWEQCLMGMSMFSALPTVWYLTRDRVVFSDAGEGRWRIRFDDREYFDAFVALNS